MTGGNIFHGALGWPFAEDDDQLDTPAQQWGVATAHERILLCGSGRAPRRCGLRYRRSQRRDGGTRVRRRSRATARIAYASMVA